MMSSGPVDPHVGFRDVAGPVYRGGVIRARPTPMMEHPGGPMGRTFLFTVVLSLALAACDEGRRRGGRGGGSSGSTTGGGGGAEPDGPETIPPSGPDAGPEEDPEEDPEQEREQEGGGSSSGGAAPDAAAAPRLEDGTPLADWVAPNDCPPGQMPELGREGCVWIGDPCPAGLWPEQIPAGEVRYVVEADPWCALPCDGDGSSPQRPLMDLREALDAVPAGGTVVLAKGLYYQAGPVTIDHGVTVLGACARDTIIHGAWDRHVERNRTVSMTGDGGRLENVTVEGDTPGVWIAGGTGTSSLRGVRIEGAKGLGVMVSGEEVGSPIEARLESVVVRGTQPRTDELAGAGIEVSSRARVTLTQVLIEGNRTLGLLVSDEGTEVIASELIVKDTLEQLADGSLGYGVAIQQGGQVTFSGALLENNRGIGLLVNGVGSATTASDLLVIETQEQVADGWSGGGIFVQKGAHAGLTRVLLRGNRSSGLSVRGNGSEVVADDLVVKDTKEEVLGGRYGMGISLDAGSEGTAGPTLRLSRVLVENNRHSGLTITNQSGNNIVGGGAQLTAEDLVVRGTRPVACAESGSPYPPCELSFGDGFLVVGGAALSLNEFQVNDNARVGVYLAERTPAEFDPTVVGDWSSGLPTIAASQGEVTGNAIGINFGTTLEDPAEFSASPGDFQRVVCKNNEQAVDGCFESQSLAVPDMSSFLEEVDPVDVVDAETPDPPAR